MTQNCPEDFESLRFQSRHMFIKASVEDVSTCTPQGPKGEPNERTYDHVIASRSFEVKIKNIEVVQDFESRPHKASSFVVERVWREQQCSKRYRIQWWKVDRKKQRQKKVERKRMRIRKDEKRGDLRNHSRCAEGSSYSWRWCHWRHCISYLQYNC